MLIANPIYDTVFKFMMSDSKVARTLLSAITGEKIVELSFSSKEHIYKIDVDKDRINKTLEQIVVCHFDFEAKIETETGHKSVLIELQKAKLATDIMRFRRYLGAMYQDSENSYDADREKARQIYCIYFLNYEIGLSSNPILKVDYIVKDLTTGEELTPQSEFIESLNHKSWILQIRQLKKRRRNDLENLLSIFDQDNKTDNRHILNVDETLFSEEYRHIIRKLREAFESKQVRDDMLIEDDYLSVLEKKDRYAAELENLVEKKDEEITKKDEEITKKDEEITIYKEELAKYKRLLEEKNK